MSNPIFNLVLFVFILKAFKGQHKHHGSQLKQFFSDTSSAWNVLGKDKTSLPLNFYINRNIHANNHAKVTTLQVPVCKNAMKNKNSISDKSGDTTKWHYG